MKSKKGLTPVIAVILLLMMTVAAAGAAFFWFIRIQSEMQGGTEVYSEQLSEKVSAKVIANKVTVDGTNLTFYMQNVGNSPINPTNSDANPTTTWILQDNKQNVLCSGGWNAAPALCNNGCNDTIDVKEIQSLSLTLSGICSIASYQNGTIFYYSIDFSGITATGGSFTK